MSTSTPSTMETGVMQQTPASASAEEDTMSAIPRRSMRVKVLYTFDDQNKSNCLTRLPNALSVPVVSLDENTQVGVIELKTCIQAIVAASPELVGKLGHDYTVYAYDFSEYETPLVGQGMLSWILASASSTPNAPADQSRTMVTGRVCNNMLGLFGQGMKETLEVKLKLVPVPTSMQQEYVENMERYHSLSQLMPEGFDYNAWSDFLKENPMLGQLAQPATVVPAQASQRSSIGGVEAFHQMLTRNSPSQEPLRADSFYDQSNMSFNNAQSTRASSPAMSTLSFHHYQYNPESRPASRTSVRSDTTYAPPPQQYEQYPTQEPYVVEQQEEGPPKKRARITQVKRPKKTPLTAHNDSLRVTASTAASVRLHRPTPGMPAAAMVSAESIPRAPTPRPGDAAFGQRGSRRPPAPSALRHASMDEGRPYMSPYDANAFSDAMETDDERGVSPGDTPMEMPSSPPIADQGTASPDQSSPTLPTLSLPNDSIPPEARSRRPYDRSGHPWQHVNPGPIDRLPQSYVPRPKQHYRKPDSQLVTESIEQNHGSPGNNGSKALADDNANTFPFPQQETNDHQAYQQLNAPARASHERSSTRPGPKDSYPFGAIHQQQSQQIPQTGTSKAHSPDASVSHVSPVSEVDANVYSRSATPNLPPQKPKPAKAKGLARSQTWSGAGEVMSDGPTASDQPRSGSGARRKKYIKDKMEQAIAAGEIPPHCKNCGEIDTPTWRKAYTRVEYGSPDGLDISTDTSGTGIIAFEVIEPTDESSGEMSYRVFKNNVTREEKECNMFEALNLCNPCGLWLIKKGAMRPRKLWDKQERGTKRKRQAAAARTKSIGQDNDLASDAAVPNSEPIMPEEREAIAATVDSIDGIMPPPRIQNRAESLQASAGTSTLDKDTAEEALRRAIQSSPAGLRGSRHSPIDIDPDLTPKPTRRLLFPSPRKDGETKFLSKDAGVPRVASEDPPKDEVQEKPRCQRCKRLRKGCDRERPCLRCDNAGIGYDGCIPCEMPRTNWFEPPIVAMATVEEENPDKENCPPPVPHEEVDEFAHLFEDPVSPKTTPKKDNLFQDLLKTPTPGSRQRNPLTPRGAADNADSLTTPSRMTPSRNIFTPRGTRAATAAPETPFTRQLNAFLSEGNYSSPSQAIDFSAFPTFNTPGRNCAQFGDFMTDEFLSSDMPMASSPPKTGALGLGFDLYEDPNTATMGLWSGASMFGSDTMLDIEDASKRPRVEITENAGSATLLKMNVGGITVDFAAMIEEVVADNNDDAELEPVTTSEAQTPAVQVKPEATAAE